MAFFDWKEEYSVGIAQIDEQHRKLVGMVNELYEAMKAGKGNDVLGKVLTELVQYTKTHFATEENLFKLHGYPEAAPHKQQHDELTARAGDLSTKFRNGEPVLSVSVSNSLKDWLQKHICGSDRKYGPFLNSKGVK